MLIKLLLGTKLARNIKCIIFNKLINYTSIKQMRQTKSAVETWCCVHNITATQVGASAQAQRACGAHFLLRVALYPHTDKQI